MEETRPIRYGSGYYAEWFIKALIAELETGTPRQDLLARHQIKGGTFSVWVQHYASSAYKNKIKKTTSPSKHAVVRAILSGRMTIEEARVACNLKTTETIRIWISNYQQENPDLSAVNSSALANKKSSVKTVVEHDQLKLLQQQLADEKLKVAALNTLIDVAEEQLKINIRKKPGAKQS